MGIEWEPKPPRLLWTVLLVLSCMLAIYIALGE